MTTSSSANLSALLLAAIVCASAANGAEDGMDVTYRDQTVRLVVGFPAGGVNDIVARQVARILPTYLPGSPRTVVQNMPGAGSMKAVEWLAQQAPRDGSVFGAIATTVIMQSILGAGDDLVAKLEWLGSAKSVTRVCFAYAATGLTDIAAVRLRGVVLGATSVGSPTSDHARLFKRVFGDRVRIVYGYTGNPDLSLAMERGEIEAVCGNSIQTVKIERPDWYAQGRLSFLLRFSDEPRGEAAMLPSYIGLLPAEEREAAGFLMRQDLFARAFAMPPSVPRTELKVLREAFDSTLNSREFRVEMARAGVEHSALSGAEMTRIIDSMRATDPALKAHARRLLSEP